jgi:hypothetical protein
MTPRSVDPSKPYPAAAGFVHLGAGLACGFTGLAAGYAIGHVGDSVRYNIFVDFLDHIAYIVVSVSGPMCTRAGSSLPWSSSSFSPRFWVCTGTFFYFGFLCMDLELSYAVQSHRCIDHELEGARYGEGVR